MNKLSSHLLPNRIILGIVHSLLTTLESTNYVKRKIWDFALKLFFTKIVCFLLEKKVPSHTVCVCVYVSACVVVCHYDSKLGF